MKLELHQCSKCKTEWNAPEAGSFDWWNNLASQSKGFVPEVGVINWLKKHTDWNEYTIKSIVGHQVQKYGKCRSCQSFLKASGIVNCSKCGALNYNFKAS